MDDDKMLLSWKDFTANVPNTFRKLWADQDFTDVTLATEDDHQIKAHKVILSSHSEFFKNLLLKNPHQNPLIYLKGIRHHKLEMLLKFIYLGQCHISNEELQDFLATGTELRIKGLIENIDPVDIENHQNNGNMKESNEPHKVGYQILQRNTQFFKSNGAQNEGNGVFPSVDNKVAEINETGKYDCTNCGKKYTSRTGLLFHTKSVHEGLRYSCDQCDHKATSQGSVKLHKQSEHEGVRFDCDQCDYKASQQGQLKRHQQSLHEGLRFNCDQCDYKATRQSSLKEHQQSIHEGVRFNCEKCDYKATLQSNLTRHQQSLHGEVAFNYD